LRHESFPIFDAYRVASFASSFKRRRTRILSPVRANVLSIPVVDRKPATATIYPPSNGRCTMLCVVVYSIVMFVVDRHNCFVTLFSRPFSASISCIIHDDPSKSNPGPARVHIWPTSLQRAIRRSHLRFPASFLVLERVLVHRDANEFSTMQTTPSDESLQRSFWSGREAVKSRVRTPGRLE
jgi:hypothetical protein